MSFENTRSITFLPTGTAAVSQYRFVQQVAAGTVEQVGTIGAVGENVMGVALDSSPTIASTSTQEGSAAIPVTMLDGSRQEIESGAETDSTDIAIGDPITSDATGRAIKADTATHKILGYSETVSDTDGQVVTFIAFRDGAFA